MTASDLVDMLAAPGNAGVAAGRRIVDVSAVVRDAVPPASHGLHGGCRRVDFACRQIHWDRVALDSLVDGVGDRDSSWGVVHYSSTLDGNRSEAAGYAVDDGTGRRWERAERRWRVASWRNWVGFASARGGHAVWALREVVCRHRRRRRRCCYDR